MTTSSWLIYAAVFSAAFGLLAWWVFRRRGEPESGLTIFLAMAGLYVGIWSATKHVHWLTVPSLALITAGVANDFRRRRSARDAHGTADQARSPDDDKDPMA